MLLSALASLALAETTVLLAPDEPITGRGGRTIELAPAATFPAGEAFKLAIPVSNNELRGSVTVWPKAVADCGEAPSGGRQLHQLALSLSADGQRLESTVPALQTRQRYCVSVKLKWPIAESDWRAVAARVADTLLAADDGGYVACTPGDFARSLETALARELAPWGISPASREKAIEEAQAHLSQAGWEAGCRERTEAATRARGIERQLQLQTATVGALRAALPTAAPATARAGSPLVYVDGKLRTLAALAADPTLGDKPLIDALGQIAVGPSKDVRGWTAAIQKVLQKSDPNARKPALDALRKKAEAAREEPLLLYTADGAPVELAPWLGAPGSRGIDLATGRAQVGELARQQPLGTAARAELDQLEAALKRYTDALEAQDRLVTAARTNQDALATANGKLRTQYLAALQKPEVRGPLTVVGVPVNTESAPTGGYTTPAVGSFAAVQGGVAAAFPSLGTPDLDTPFSALPYVALNVYFTPVDRTIDLDQLVGSTFLQRFSLLGGAAMGTNPIQVEGRDTESALGEFYPVVGASYRVRNYMNVTAGTVLYRLSDASPASSAAPIRPAPFVGLSFDLDVVKLLTDAL